jgi:hypothetical protein
MSGRSSMGRPQRRLLIAIACLGCLSVLGGLLVADGATRASGAAGVGGEPSVQSDASVPAFRVTMIGASPLEAPDETWGIGEADQGGVSSWAVVRYTESSGWLPGPGLLDTAGQPLAGFRPDAPKAPRSSNTSPLAGQMTPGGDGVLVGTVPGASGTEKVVLVRNPGGAFQETAPVPPPSASPPKGGAEPLLQQGETLFGGARAPLIAPLQEAGNHAGALVVAVNEEGGGVEDGVLHWDGSHWTRESIEIPSASAKEFRVLAIGASSPSNAWLLGQLASNSHYPPGAVALFRRRLGGAEGPTWQPVAPAPAATPGEPLTVPVTGSTAPFSVAGTGEPPTVLAQILTVTGEGVWIDGERLDTSVSTTLFFKPEGEGDGGRVVAGWCQSSAGQPCAHELPEPLPTGPSRSIAWANPSTPEGVGERIIAGLPEGVSLRLDGTSFTRVLALGGSNPPNDVGGTFGAAFTDPREGWLGQARLPLHLTLHPVQTRLQPWPTAFRHALIAIAPQPGAPVGSLSSEALAVGDQGEVARYEPGKGWLPESLLNPGGRALTPRLRAVAWPTPSRAYAVGDLGQMWLWRAETGFWEQDPATPFNFRGNLLSIAFQPGDPEQGYAVGQGGLLLSYGKTWTQEPTCAPGVSQPCLPPQVAGATFTSVAFAGSEAIVAYHLLPDPSKNLYVGGLLVNNGSGWEVDEGAAKAMGQNVPWAVAGLPDGGAALTAGEASGSGLGGVVLERSEPGASWAQTPTPLPGGAEPGSLALFREGGALRAVTSGSVPNTYALESEPSPPAGFPANLIPPYPLSAEYGAGHVLRQTASGWSDEEHELNNVQEPPGNYAEYDMVYKPDPISAVLINATGGEGWAVGGFVDTIDRNGALDTADVERYPADGVAPVGTGTSAIPTEKEVQENEHRDADFAIGGGAQCAAPCADLENAHIGPDVWLSSALARAKQIANMRAFLYTGPRVTGGTGSVITQELPFARELGRYAQLVSSSPLPAFVAASPTDLDGPLSEGTFESAFKQLPGFPQPLGSGSGLSVAGHSSESCAGAPGCQRAYYSLESTGEGGSVRVIVLDDTTGVGQTQQAWLQAQLDEAAAELKPAIVVGNADLKAQVEAHDASAIGVAEILAAGHASGYFYDAPEQNVKETLHMPDGYVRTFGSGTLGYVNHIAESQGDFIGASGFLLVQIGADPSAREASGQYPVHVTLVPNIAELALEAKDGTLLRRSEVASFAALARRPRAGNRSQNQALRPDTSPYIPIPANCRGTACESNGLFPEYEFSSSNPNVGNFVEPNLASGASDAVKLEGANEEPIPDPKSELFCAYEAGPTTITVRAGGLSASLPVTVQEGSVRRPCVHQTRHASTSATQSASPAAPAPAPAAAPAGTPPTTAPPILPVPPAPAIATPIVPAPRTPPPPFFLPPIPATPLIVFAPPLVPTPARPTPPSGTSAVTSPIEVAEHEEEDEEATESASAAAAYHPTEHEPWPVFVLGAVLLAAFAGASGFRRPRRGRRELRVAPATLTTTRAQRRMTNGRRR